MAAYQLLNNKYTAGEIRTDNNKEDQLYVFIAELKCAIFEVLMTKGVLFGIKGGTMAA